MQLEAEFGSALETGTQSETARARNQWSTWLFPKTVAGTTSGVPRFATAALVQRWPDFGLTAVPRDHNLPARAVYLAGRLDRRILDAVQRGASLVLLSGGRSFQSRPVTYRTTWWKAGDDLNANVCGTFVYDHPVTRGMAPDRWCDAGWFHLVEGARKIGLESFPVRPNVIVRALPSLRAVQDEALLFEVGIGEGSILVSGLNHQQSRGRPENDWLIGRMLAHASTFPHPEPRWPISALPVSDEPLLSDALSGYEKLLRNEGEEGVWFSYREDNVRMPVCRQNAPGHLVEWETAVVPQAEPSKRLTFAFAGGLGYRSEPKTAGFTFLVNGNEQLRFDLPESTNQWRSADGRVELRFMALRHLPQDQLGVFMVTLPADFVPAGQPCRLGVRSLGQGSRRWFGLNQYNDAHLTE